VYVQIIVILAVPKELKKRLKKQAKKLKLNEKRTDAYVYGTIKKIEKAKGKKRKKRTK
jgi:hypothetical protein|tara:strand:- start:687 stop:860 length:174 start_codon:yes stop_codon:yes gene_type:complete